MTLGLTIGRIARLLLALFVAYGFFVQLFFFFHFIHGPAYFFSRFIVVPAAIVTASEDGSRKTLSYTTTLQLARAAEAFGLSAQASAEADSPKPFDEGLRIGVHRLYVQQLADELAVEVTDEEVSSYQVDEAAIAGGLEEAGWTIDEYRKYVVEPLLLAQKVEQAVYGQDESQAPARQELEDLLAKVEEGIPFADVALHYSQDSVTAPASGNLGLMSIDEVPDWLRPAVNLETGQRSGILSAGDAYWVVEVVSKEVIGEEEFVQFRGIAVNKMSLGEIIATRRADNPPLVFVW